MIDRSLHSRMALALALAIIALAALVIAPPARADGQTLPFVSPLFTDNMVLQRSRHDPIWGWAAPGTKVTVSLAGKSASATAGAGGKWVASLPALKAGGPYDLSIDGPQHVVLHNVMAGDVWICSGQSNMQFGVGNLLNPDQVIDQANDPDLRLYTVAMKPAAAPVATADGRWLPCTPDNL